MVGHTTQTEGGGGLRIPDRGHAGDEQKSAAVAEASPQPSVGTDRAISRFPQ
jgi:hypothetical protein